MNPVSKRGLANSSTNAQLVTKARGGDLKLPGIVGASGGYSNTRSQPRSTALGGYSKPRNQMGSAKRSAGGQSDGGSGGGGEAAKVKKL